MGLLRRTPSRDSRRDDRKFVGRTEPGRGLVVVAAEGSRVRDARGRSFIDFEMGWCVGNLGWNPPEILARLRGFDGPSYVAPQSSYAPWSELARRLVGMTPGDLGRAYRCVGRQLGDEDLVEELETKCRDRGLIIVGEEDEVMLLPPCNVDEKTVGEALEIIEGVV